MIRVIEIVTGGWDVFIGLALLICSFTISFKENQDQKDTSYKHLLFANLILQISDLLAWIFRGNGTTLGYYMVRISNFWFYIGMAAIPWTASRFIYYQVKDSYPDTGKYFIRIQNALATGSILLIVINVFTGILYSFDAHNFYQREPGLIFIIFNGLAYASIILIHAYAWKYRKNRNGTITKIVRLTCILVEVAGTYQVLFYGISAFNIACTAGMLLLFTGILRQRSEIQRIEQQQLEESREKLAKTRQQMLQLKIQPHFTYNTIAAIQAQVLEDQEKAYESIGTFSAYLRDTIYYSRTNQLISMEEELNFVEKYLELAEMRFGDKLNIEFDIQTTDFQVLPFTIQPLIENALSHGLKPFGHEGTIYIRTYRKDAESDSQISLQTETTYVIEVEDNGIGMNPALLNQLHEKVQNHIGLMNVKQRIEMACRGYLEVISPVEKYSENRDDMLGAEDVEKAEAMVKPEDIEKAEYAVQPTTESKRIIAGTVLQNRKGTKIRIRIPENTIRE